LIVISAIERSLCAFARDGFLQMRKGKMDKVGLTTEIPESLKYGTSASEARLYTM
jgi:hypothetical protein